MLSRKPVCLERVRCKSWKAVLHKQCRNRPAAIPIDCQANPPPRTGGGSLPSTHEVYSLNLVSFDWVGMRGVEPLWLVCSYVCRPEKRRDARTGKADSDYQCQTARRPSPCTFHAHPPPRTGESLSSLLSTHEACTLNLAPVDFSLRQGEIFS